MNWRSLLQATVTISWPSTSCQTCCALTSCFPTQSEQHKQPLVASCSRPRNSHELSKSNAISIRMQAAPARCRPCRIHAAGELLMCPTLLSLALYTLMAAVLASSAAESSQLLAHEGYVCQTGGFLGSSMAAASIPDTFAILTVSLIAALCPCCMSFCCTATGGLGVCHFLSCPS